MTVHYEPEGLTDAEFVDWLASIPAGALLLPATRNRVYALMRWTVRAHPDSNTAMLATSLPLARAVGEMRLAMVEAVTEKLA